jgi:hypothetical protein
MATMTLGGLWHGAGWTFVLWGLFHGGLLCAHRALEPVLARVCPVDRGPRSLWYWIRVAVFFHLVCFGWLLFRAEDLTQVGVMLLACITEISTRLSDTVWPPPCGPRAEISTFSAIGLLVVCAALFLVQLKQLVSGRLEFVPSLRTGTRAGLYVSAILAFLWFGATNGAAFIYFAF